MRRDRPKGKDANSVTVTELAKEQGVSQVTANRRMALADDLGPYPEAARQFDEEQATSSGRKESSALSQRVRYVCYRPL